MENCLTTWLFCFAQLQIDSMIAGYKTFLVDPQLNIAKTLLAVFGLVNTSIILIQIHCIYNGDKNKIHLVEEHKHHCDCSKTTSTSTDEFAILKESLLVAHKLKHSHSHAHYHKHSLGRGRCTCEIDIRRSLISNSSLETWS